MTVERLRGGGLALPDVRPLPGEGLALAAMALSLGLVAAGGRLHSPVTAAAGLLFFGALACFLPRLGLLFVILTAPLYLIPTPIPGLRAQSGAPFLLPLHEVALLLTAGGWAAARLVRPPAERWRPGRAELRWAAPLALLALSGAWGVAAAVDRGTALRELRWLIVEPLAFYALLQAELRAPGGARLARQAAGALLLAAAAVGLLGVLQAAGLDLVPLLGTKQCTCDNVMLYGAARRASSVYGSPNNLALFLERAWPVAAALLVGARGEERRRRWIELGAPLALALAGVAVSFSRGAWLGGAVALAVLAALTVPAGRRAGLGWPVCAAGLLALGGGLVLALRADSLADGSSVRLLLWGEALGYLRAHPLGIGLDQFLVYHLPGSGRSLIAPELVGTPVESVSHPHNMLLDAWLRLGPAGVAAFAWLVARLVRAGRAAARAGAVPPLLAGALAATAGALAHGLVDQFYFVPDLAVAFWLLLALGEAARREGEPPAEAAPML